MTWAPAYSALLSINDDWLVSNKMERCQRIDCDGWEEDVDDNEDIEEVLGDNAMIFPQAETILT